MAIIVLHHTVADNLDIDPARVTNSTNRILAGNLVGLNSLGFVALAQDDSTAVPALGIAGDSLSDEYKTTAYSAQLIISPGGAKRYTSNRVSDMFNEGLASGKMTVYIGSGKFATDRYDTNGSVTSSYTPGAKLYSTRSTHNLGAGIFTTASGAGWQSTDRVVGYVVAAPTAYPSGVPGVDSPSVANSMSLGTFLIVHLSI